LNVHSICWSVSTADQLLYGALHGTAVRYAAEQRDLSESIAELREIAGRVIMCWRRLPASRPGRGMPTRPAMSGMS
jgi:hypothetical protein